MGGHGRGKERVVHSGGGVLRFSDEAVFSFEIHQSISRYGSRKNSQTNLINRNKTDLQAHSLKTRTKTMISNPKSPNNISTNIKPYYPQLHPCDKRSPLVAYRPGIAQGGGVSDRRRWKRSTSSPTRWAAEMKYPGSCPFIHQ